MRPESAYSTHTANSRAGGTICRVRAGVCICLHESGMLRRTHQLSCILKAKLAGKSHAGRLFQPVCGIPRRMTSTLASSDLCEQLAALLLGDAPCEDVIGATADRVSPSQPHYVLSGYISSGRILSFRWSRISEIHASGFSMVPTILGGPHRWSTVGTASFEVLVRPPSPSSAG